LQPKKAYATQDVPMERWMYIAVPAIVDPAVFDAVQEQLVENKQRARTDLVEQAVWEAVCQLLEKPERLE
jgi:hypothetical protein